MSRPRYLVTHSLLSAYAWSFSDEGRKDFLRTLHREPSEPNEAMINGREFERLVSEMGAGLPVHPHHRWYEGIAETTQIVTGAAEQVRCCRDMTVDNMDLLLYGILDGLREGTIFDIKFVKKYRYGKYHSSTQHPMYFALVPEARRFIYVISDGCEVWQEAYHAYDTPDIAHSIREFMRFLQARGLMETYQEYWRTKE